MSSAQRAALMVLGTAIAIIARRPLVASRQLALACTLSVIVAPIVVWLPGFLLSFAAVTILIWHAMQLGSPSAEWRSSPQIASAAAVRQ